MTPPGTLAAQMVSHSSTDPVLGPSAGLCKQDRNHDNCDGEDQKQRNPHESVKETERDS